MNIKTSAKYFLCAAIIMVLLLIFNMAFLRITAETSMQQENNTELGTEFSNKTENQGDLLENGNNGGQDSGETVNNIEPKDNVEPEDNVKTEDNDAENVTKASFPLPLSVFQFIMIVAMFLIISITSACKIVDLKQEKMEKLKNETNKNSAKNSKAAVNGKKEPDYVQNGSSESNDSSYYSHPKELYEKFVAESGIDNPNKSFETVLTEKFDEHRKFLTVKLEADIEKLVERKFTEFFQKLPKYDDAKKMPEIPLSTQKESECDDYAKFIAGYNECVNSKYNKKKINEFKETFSCKIYRIDNSVNGEDKEVIEYEFGCLMGINYGVNVLLVPCFNKEKDAVRTQVFNISHGYNGVSDYLLERPALADTSSKPWIITECGILK